MSCADPVPKDLKTKVKSDFNIDIESLVTKEKSARLERIKSRYSKLVPVETLLLSGTAFIEIIKQVINQKHDLLIVKANDQSKLRSEYPGSTELHLIRKCPCPVWLFKSGKAQFERILVAVDSSAESNAEKRLNQRLLEISTSLVHAVPL